MFKLPVVESDVALRLVEADIQVVDTSGSLDFGGKSLVFLY